jgi:transposase, IS30 family
VHLALKPFATWHPHSAIGTLVERSTGYAMLLHPSDGYSPEQVGDALAAKIKTLPESLRLSLT